MTIIHKVAKALSAAPGAKTDDLAQATNIPRQQVRNALSRLSYEDKAYSIRRGSDARWFAGSLPKEPLPVIARPDRINKMAGHWDCPELRTMPYRPGAMDAFKLPSRGIA